VVLVDELADLVARVEIAVQPGLKVSAVHVHEIGNHILRPRVVDDGLAFPDPHAA
jgi:hypothetical protein